MIDRKDPAPSVWLLESPPPRIAKGSIDRAAIATAAAELLDENGLQKLTMRELGSRLGVSAMACYAHVRHKDDVLELAQDRVMGELSVATGPWSTVLRVLAEDYRHLLVDHPWLPVLAGRFLNAGPRTSAMTQTAARRLADGGLPPHVVPSALSAAFTLAHGYGTVEATWNARTESTPVDAIVSRLAAQHPHDPVLGARAAHGSAQAGEQDWRFALDSLLRGIESHPDVSPMTGGAR